MKKKVLFILIVILAILLALTLYKNHQQQTQKGEYFVIVNKGDENKVWEIIKENGLEKKAIKRDAHNGYYAFDLAISDSEMTKLMTTKGIHEYLFFWGNTKTDSNNGIKQMLVM